MSRTEMEITRPAPWAEAIVRASAYVLPDAHWALRRALADAGSVLDVGCGVDVSPLSFFEKPPGQRRIGIDRYAPSIERSRAAGMHDEYVHADILAFADDPANAGRFDAVVALDVVEHFEKPQSIALVERLERLAKRRVVVLTPNGFLPQEPYDGNEFQRHLCGWTVDEFEARGYTVRGVYGLKPLRGEYARPVIRPALLGQALAMASQPLAYAMPRWAFSLLAIKER